MKSFRLIPLLLLLVLSACSSSRNPVRVDSAEEAYRLGMEAQQRNRHERAAEYFQRVFEFGRTSPVAADAQIALAESYSASRQHLLAVSEYSRFTELYRTDPRVPDAEFARSMASMEMAPGPELDQTSTLQALTFFQLFISRNPNDPRRATAEGHVRELRDRLARKSYDAARLYERRDLFEAAAITYEATFERYPETSWADDALVGAMRSYLGYAQRSIPARQEERYRKGLTHYQRLVDIFPDSPLRPEAERIRTQIQQALGTVATN